MYVCEVEVGLISDWRLSYWYFAPFLPLPVHQVSHPMIVTLLQTAAKVARCMRQLPTAP